MSKQTAVEWLVEQVNADCLNSTFIRKELIDEAKAMERQQIEEAVQYGQCELGTYWIMPPEDELKENSKEYYDAVFVNSPTE